MAATATLDGVTVNGDVNLIGGLESALETKNTTKITGNVTLKSPFISYVETSGTFESGKINISATQANDSQAAASLSAGGSFKSGDITVSASGDQASLNSTGTLTAGKISVTAKTDAKLTFGTSAVTGDINVKSGRAGSVAFGDNGGDTASTGNITVKGVERAELDDGTALTAKDVKLTSTGYAAYPNSMGRLSPTRLLSQVVWRVLRPSMAYPRRLTRSSVSSAVSVDPYLRTLR